MKQLRSELATLDRKIAVAPAPKHDEKDGEEVKRDEPQQKQEAKTVEVQSTGEKKSLVAEPQPSYDNDIRHSPQQSP
ncbi:MAG: hypothetical protein NC489_33370 [Ruminococcus flavefaciens]|nr:hypothetical protein [Ruminococcus flavefaciens]